MIDRTWTLFLDRDGVINRRIVDGYVLKWDQFEFLAGVKESLKIFNTTFGKIFVVSNQQGIGKGFMDESMLKVIHDRMTEEISGAGGRIDRVYFSPSLKSEQSFFRKPNVGMALKARKEFPGVTFKQSVMAGDSISDMRFGKRLGMKTVFISTDRDVIVRNYRLIDFVYPDLLSYARSFVNE